jgi:hypothetical protein
VPENAGDAARRLAADPPEWLAALGTAALGGDSGIRRLDPEEWEEVKDPTGYPAQTVLIDRLRAADTAVRAGKVLVAQGPSTRQRRIPVDEPVGWYADPAEPDQLWCALGPGYPGWLWVPVTPQPGALAEVLGGMFPKPALKMADFTRHERGFVGPMNEIGLPNVYTGEFVPFNGHDLDRYNTGVPFLDGGSWGSAHVNDPQPDDVEFASPLAVLAAINQDRHGQQMLGRVPSMTWRTMHSRSYVSFEIHTLALVCVRLSYRPAPASHQAVVARRSAELGFNLPGDVPLDVVGALTGFPYNAEADIIESATSARDPAQLAEGLRLFAAMAEGDLERMMPLREYARHPDPAVRLSVLRIANWYNLAFLFYDVALASQDDPDILRAAEDLIERGADPDNSNVFRDHFAGYPMFVGEDGQTDPGEWPDEDDEYDFDDEDDDLADDEEDEGND